MLGAPEEGAPVKGGGSLGGAGAAAPAHAGQNGGALAAPAPSPPLPADPRGQALPQQPAGGAAARSGGTPGGPAEADGSRQAGEAQPPAAQPAPPPYDAAHLVEAAAVGAPGLAAAAANMPGTQQVLQAAPAEAAGDGDATADPSAAMAQQTGAAQPDVLEGVPAPAPTLQRTAAGVPGIGVTQAAPIVLADTGGAEAQAAAAAQAPQAAAAAAASSPGAAAAAAAAAAPAAALSPGGLGVRPAAPSATAAPALLPMAPNGAQALPLGLMPLPWRGLLPPNGGVRPGVPLLRPVQVAPGFAAGVLPLAASSPPLPAVGMAGMPAVGGGAAAAALGAGMQQGADPPAAAMQPPGAASLGLGQPAAGDKRKADVALGQPLAPPPPMAPPPVLGIPMLPPPVSAATAVLGQPLNGPPPLGPLPLFHSMAPPAPAAAPAPAPAPGAAPAGLASGVTGGAPSSSANPEPSGEAGIDEEPPASEAGAAGGGGRKSRLVWTQELHNRFINALSHLGLKNAVPKSILALMNVEGMTRENVASHLQKYRLYLRRLGGVSERDRVDADTLQRLHEQNVQQMAAQQVLQHSLVAMQGPHPGVLAAMGIGLGGAPAPVGGYPLLPLPPHAAAAAAASHAALAAMPAAMPAAAAAAAGGAAGTLPALAAVGLPASQPAGAAAGSELLGTAAPSSSQQAAGLAKAEQCAASGASPAQQHQQPQADEPPQPGDGADTHSSLAALAAAAEAEAAHVSGSLDAEAAQAEASGPAGAPGTASGAGGVPGGGSAPADLPQLTVSTSSGPAPGPPAAPHTAAAAPATPTDRQ